MLLVLAITSHCHYYLWDRMCSTDPFQFRWLKGYTHSSSYHHHNQIGSVNLSHCYIFFSVVVCLRWLLVHILSLIAYKFRDNRDFVSIIIVQFMTRGNSGIRLGVQIIFVYLYITPSHYHHCANIFGDIELIKCLSDIFVERVSKIKHILSVIHYTIYGFVCFQFTHFPCDDLENINSV